MARAINKASSVPLYLQLRETLLEQIEQGALRPGDRLPSERELSEEYGLSRMTARQALTELAREGWVYSSIGKGTYVAERKIEQELQRLIGFTEDMRRRGMVASSRILEAVTFPATSRLAETLQIAPGLDIIRLERLRLADDKPLALETLHVPQHLCPGLLQQDLADRSLYDIMETKYGLRLGTARQTLTAALANQRERELLGLASPAAILLMESIVFLENGQVVECGRSAYRGDRYMFHTVMQRTR